MATYLLVRWSFLCRRAKSSYSLRGWQMRSHFVLGQFCPPHFFLNPFWYINKLLVKMTAKKGFSFAFRKNELAFFGADLSDKNVSKFQFPFSLQNLVFSNIDKWYSFKPLKLRFYHPALLHPKDEDIKCLTEGKSVNFYTFGLKRMNFYSGYRSFFRELNICSTILLHKELKNGLNCPKKMRI